MRGVTRIIRAILIVGMCGLGALLVSNLVRARWFLSVIDAILILALAGLSGILNRRPQLERPVGVVMAMMLLAIPLVLIRSQPGDIGSILAILAICAVAILSVIWPAAGWVAILAETALLLWLALAVKTMSVYVPAAFAVASSLVYLISRALRQALAQTEAAQSALAEKNQALEQTLGQLQAVMAQDRLRVETIRELEVPLIESERGEGILVAVGRCTAERMQSIAEKVFARLRQRAFRRLVIDVSGATFDPAGLEALIKMLQSLRLMVSHVVVSGMAPEQATDLAADRERVRLLRQTIRFVHSLQEAMLD